MKAHSLRILALVSVPAFGAACADTESGPTGPQVEITVAPLTLPGVDEGCFGITVYNGVPGAIGTDTVWSNANVCSGQYGNGQGDITYIGPCDASVAGNNFIALTLKSLSANNALLSSPQDYVNPCPAAGPCVLDFKCEANADVLVEFNLTVMRNALQGFFDIIVNFEDIFCSAKFDSCYDVQTVRVDVRDTTTAKEHYVYETEEVITEEQRVQSSVQAIYVARELNETQTFDRWAAYLKVGDATANAVWSDTVDVKPVAVTYADRMYSQSTAWAQTGGTAINLLHGDDGREHTAVAAVACTAGPGTDTELLMRGPVVSCNDGDVSFKLDLDTADGGNETATSTPLGFTLPYAVYFGNEQLNCGGTAEAPISCGKVYYNIAFNLQALADQKLYGCRLFYGVTATEVGSAVFTIDGVLADTNGVYPGIGFGDLNGVAMTGPQIFGVGELFTVAPLCFGYGLNNEGSQVQTGYLKGNGFQDTNAANFTATFYSAGVQAKSFPRVVPIP